MLWNCVSCRVCSAITATSVMHNLPINAFLYFLLSQSPWHHHCWCKATPMACHFSCLWRSKCSKSHLFVCMASAMALKGNYIGLLCSPRAPQSVKYLMKTQSKCSKDTRLIYVAVFQILWGDEVMRACFLPMGRQKQFMLTLRKVGPN